jgi:hypothetical protein
MQQKYMATTKMQGAKSTWRRRILPTLKESSAPFANLF